MKRIFPNRVYVSGKRWCVWYWTDVDPLKNGEIYLTRLHLFQTPWCSLMLHWILKPDPQEDLHDHPVTFLSILLSGSYTELLPNNLIKQIRFFNFKRSTDSHKIISLSGNVLTLVFAGKVTRSWGFHTSEGWVNWRNYVAKLRNS